MFDPQLVPAYLAQQAQQQQQSAQATVSPPPGDGPPPAKRPRRQRGGVWPRAGNEATEVAAGAREDDAAEEERRGAQEHLAELTLGFAQDSFLAPWLRRLLQQPPDGQPPGLAERVWQLALSWSDVEAWQPRLAAACGAAGLPQPQHRHEWLPLATGCCVVFEASWAVLLLLGLSLCR